MKTEGTNQLNQITFGLKDEVKNFTVLSNIS